MNCIRLPRPNQLELDLRADTPMRDDIGILNGTPVSDHRSNGMSTPSHDAPPPTSFTAVNGDAHRPISFRPEGPGSRSIILPPVEHISNVNGDRTPAAGAYPAHNWRPTEQRPTTQLEGSPANGTSEAPSNKRKRDDSPADEPREDGRRQQSNSVAGSPKRRADDGNDDEANDSRRSRDGLDDLEEATTGAYERVSPPRTGAAPPAPRPEVAAELAAQVQQFSGQAQAQARPGSSTSPEDAQARQRSYPYSSDPGQALEDRSKRKRNFSNRTKTGCHTCRKRKKKCDEGKPECQNCQRGSFECEGYGPKPVGGAKTGPTRSVIPLQSKESYPPLNGYHHYGHEMGPYHEAHARALQPGGERYAPSLPPIRYSGPPPAETARPMSARDGYAPWHDARHAPHMAHQHISPDMPRPPPPHAQSYPAPPPMPYSSYPPPNESWSAPPPPMYAPPPHAPIARTVMSSHPSILSSNSGSHHSGLLSHSDQDVRDSARARMLRGEPYPHFNDSGLKRERQSCQRAVEQWNNSFRGPPIVGAEKDQEKNFLAIYQPANRQWESGSRWDGPKGSVGSHSVVEAPFTCEFGYNIHLGNEVLIQPNCTMQDASIIYIGDRTIVGPNVKFYCITTSMDPAKRNEKTGPLKRDGPQFEAGPIRVEEDVVINADCIILPFRTIGKGAVVGAGSVVTRVSFFFPMYREYRLTCVVSGCEALYCRCWQPCKASQGKKKACRWS